MMKHALAVLALAAALPVLAAEPRLVHPFESDAASASTNPIDAGVQAVLRQRGLAPAPPCSDEVFVRRAYLDVIGTLPEPAEVRAFLSDSRPDKRAALIDALLVRPEFADYWALKWCDVLRVKAEFPINLWPNAVQAYHHWIREAVRENKPYDQFARELLTSSGSNFRVPAVNFYRAVQGREPSAIAGAVALTFMGARIDAWPPERRAGLAACFSRLEYKHTAEWKEEIVIPCATPDGPLAAVFPDGTKVRMAPDQDPRAVFADWLISAKNPWFAKCAVNRVWAWLFGRGIIHEPDDIRPDNPPANPELLACLEKQLVDSGWDLRRVYRLILTSRTYQQSSIPRAQLPDAETYFACYPVRRLDAEVLCDALDWIGGQGQEYSSPIPEPFTYIPQDHPTIALADGSISSSFLEMFGRPPRDTGLFSERNSEPSDAQRLYLLNSTDVARRIQNSPRLARLVQANPRDRGELVREIYLTLLSRFPTEAELAALQKYVQSSRLNPRQVQEDLVWSLINSKEFLYRH